jgi:Domain of unknown function (DUF6915)
MLKAARESWRQARRLLGDSQLVRRVQGTNARLQTSCASYHSDGAFLAERIFGVSIRNSDALEVPVRYIAEQHIKEDLGRIPTVQDWLAEIRAQPWMYGQKKGQQ